MLYFQVASVILAYGSRRVVGVPAPSAHPQTKIEGLPHTYYSILPQK